MNMEQSPSGLLIEQTQASEENCHPRILAAKVYCIIEQPEHDDEDGCNPYLCIPKEVVNNENCVEINDSESEEEQPDQNNGADCTPYLCFPNEIVNNENCVEIFDSDSEDGQPDPNVGKDSNAYTCSPNEVVNNENCVEINDSEIEEEQPNPNDVEDCSPYLSMPVEDCNSSLSIPVELVNNENCVEIDDSETEEEQPNPNDGGNYNPYLCIPNEVLNNENCVEIDDSETEEEQLNPNDREDCNPYLCIPNVEVNNENLVEINDLELAQEQLNSYVGEDCNPQFGIPNVEVNNENLVEINDFEFAQEQPNPHAGEDCNPHFGIPTVKVINGNRVEINDLKFVQEQPNPHAGEYCNPHFGIPNVEVNNENSIEIHASDSEMDGEEFYEEEQLQESDSSAINGNSDGYSLEYIILGKDKIQEPNNSDTEFIDESVIAGQDSDANNIAPVDKELIKKAHQDFLRRNTILLCPYCGTEYSSLIIWREHLNNVHDHQNRDLLNMDFQEHDKTAKCRQCATVINARNKRTLQQHRITHLPNSRYVKCKLCERCFARNQGLASHLERDHCDRITFQNTNHKSKKKIPKNLILLCPFCGIEFSKCFDWREHVNQVHKLHRFEGLNMEFIDGIRVKCKQCHVELNGKRFKSMQLHKIIHLPYNRYVKCKLCAKRFTRIANFTNHNEKIHCRASFNESNPTLSCAFCDMIFSTVTGWRHHIDYVHQYNERCNMNITPQSKQCRLCGKICESSDILKNHCISEHKVTVMSFFDAGQNHESLATYTCPYCGIEYPNIYQWRKHVNDVHEVFNRENLNMEFFDNNTAKCKECSAFIYSTCTWSLQRHKMQHMQYNRYIKCKLCDQLFTNGSPLKYHLRKRHKIPYEKKCDWRKGMISN